MSERKRKDRIKESKIKNKESKIGHYHTHSPPTHTHSFLPTHTHIPHPQHTHPPTCTNSLTHAEVLVNSDRLPSLVNHLVVEEGSSACREARGGAQVRGQPLDSLKVLKGKKTVMGKRWGRGSEHEEGHWKWKGTVGRAEGKEKKV